MSSTEKTEIIYEGIAASPGVAHGPALVTFQRDIEIPSYQIGDDRLEIEVDRFEVGLMETRQQISEIRHQIANRLGEEEARIFDAHLLVLEDRALIEETIREIKESKFNLEHCLHKVCKRYIEAFEQIEDDYFKERVTDIRDVSGRLLNNLLGQRESTVVNLVHKKVLVGADLSPSEAAGLEKSGVLAIVTDAGSRTSHAVIMARSMEVPAVVGLHDITSKVKMGDDVLVDGYDGLVIVNPSKNTLFRYGKLRFERENLENLFQKSLHEAPLTRDGSTFKLLANIEGYEDIGVLNNCGCEGVGLFRTEALYLRSDRFPSEEEQYEVYWRIAKGLSPKPVVIRTLDLGGDKVLHGGFFNHNEENPFMGFRAIRYCLENQKVFKDQLRAILRANTEGNVRVMFPMISGLDELLKAKEVLEQAKEELSDRGIPFNPDLPVGSMIEIPSAAAIADILAKECDFFSVGTNDLIQYLLAADRVNDRIAHLYDPGHPAVLRTLRNVINAARDAGIPVSVCGEMASDPHYAPLILGLGANDLSLSTIMISEIKYLLQKVSVDEMVSLAGEIMANTDSKLSHLRLRDFYHENIEN